MAFEAAPPAMTTKTPSIRITDLPYLIWKFTENDITTFAIPNAGFGLLAASAAPTITTCNEHIGLIPIISHAAPPVLLFNWANLLVFTIANQRLPESIKEDSVNKPWRLLPRGCMSSAQARQLLLWTVPAVLGFGVLMNVERETALILVLTWMYNDLHGCDELTRDFIIAVAYDLFLLGSLRIALKATTTCTNVGLSSTGYRWLRVIAGIVLTTMQIQDLQDQAGDRTRRRKTWPLVVGDRASRVWLATCMPLWSIFCVRFWEVPLVVSIGTVLLGAWISFCVLRKTGDTSAWKWWCFWQVILYSLPVWHYWGGAVSDP